MVGLFFETIGEVITGFVQNVASALQSVTSMFYTAGASGSAGSLTPLGVLLLIAVGTGLVFWAFGLIKSLVRRA